MVEQAPPSTLHRRRGTGKGWRSMGLAFDGGVRATLQMPETASLGSGIVAMHPGPMGDSPGLTSSVTVGKRRSCGSETFPLTCDWQAPANQEQAIGFLGTTVNNSRQSDGHPSGCSATHERSLRNCDRPDGKYCPLSSPSIPSWERTRSRRRVGSGRGHTRSRWRAMRCMNSGWGRQTLACPASDPNDERRL